jgi:predicted amidohydrolase
MLTMTGRYRVAGWVDYHSHFSPSSRRWTTTKTYYMYPHLPLFLELGAASRAMFDFTVEGDMHRNEERIRTPSI